MKIKLFTALMILTLLAGCTTLGSIKDPAQINPLGVVSVSAKGEIGWYGESGNSGGANILGNLIDKAVDSQKDEKLSLLFGRTEMILDMAEKTLMEGLSKKETVNLVDKKEILTAPVYLAQKEMVPDGLMDLVQPEGYKLISIKDKSFAEKISSETPVVGQVYVDYAFDKIMMGGVEKNGFVGAAVSMSIQIMDQTGNLVFTKSYFARSKEKTAIIAGVFDVEVFTAFFPAIITEITEKFVAEF